MEKEQLYVLKVSLSHAKRIWRRIEILGSQSLDQLHETIFQAFDRDDPHMYSFYLTKAGSKSRKRFAEAPEFTHPFAIEEDFGWGYKKLQDATKTKISELQLVKKGTFEYLFDFGDEWLHQITVEKILDLYPSEDYPKITEKKGSSPPQYPDYDDYEDEYE
ncbi:MAG: plasmid pRiA4b ORF-3 family protein [Deltaproteobacteria bacterium]|nr:plasmid pRiA4b ORF-3 family protein [Deltaproteobacteria bacterium]